MAETVSIIINAKDNASKILGGVGAALGNIAKVAAGAAVVGIAALTKGLYDSVNAAMEAEAIQAQLDAVLKSTGGAAGMTADAINDMASKLSKVTKFEDDAIVGGENMLLTFTNIGKDVFPGATEAMLDMSTAMGTDLQSSAVMLGKALNNPAEGLSALTRVGVTFTAEQERMVKQMMAAGDVAGAQAIILGELQKEFGGSAEAAGQTFAGQLEIAKNALGNMGEAIGTAMLPALTALTTSLVDTFNSPEFQAGIANVANWLQINLPIAIQILSDFWTTVLWPAIQTVWNWMSTVLIPFLQTVVYPWLSVNIPIAIQVLSDFWTTVLWPAIQVVWEWMSTVLLPFLQTVVFPWLQEHIPAAIQTLSDFWTNTLWPAMQNIWTFLTVDMMPIWEALGKLLTVTVGAAIEALTIIWNEKLLPAITTIWEFIRDKLIPKVDAMSSSFGGASGIISGVAAAINAVSNAIASIDINKLLTILSTGGKPAGNYPGYGPRARGGSVFGDTPYLVGEEGPEIFVPGGSGNIIPNNKLGSSVTNNYYLNANYQNQSPSSILSDIRMLELLHS
jgi:hypothetical protein